MTNIVDDSEPVENVWEPTHSQLDATVEFERVAGKMRGMEDVILFAQSLLPDESLLAVLKGQQNLMPLHLAVTQLQLIVVEQGMMQTTIFALPLATVDNWEWKPGSTGPKILINTASSPIRAGRLDARQLGYFVTALETARNALGPGGLLPTNDVIFGELDPCLGELEDPKSKLAPANIDNVSPLRQISDLIIVAFSDTLGEDEPTLSQVSALLACVSLTDSSDREFSRLADVWMRKDSLVSETRSVLNDRYATILEDPRGKSALREVLRQVSIVSDVFARHGSDAVRRQQRARAQDLQSTLVVGEQVSGTGNFDSAMKGLNGLTGLASVKSQVASLANVIKVQKMRGIHGLTADDGMSHHLVFTGNPGTGKTTVARLVGDIYRALGVLPSGHVVEVARSDLVGEYVGHTAIKTTEVFDRARGGVLFIDEAYTLSRTGMKGDFGQEAIDTLVKLMEDNRHDTAVIAAGYSTEMDEFLESNPGLRSRFGNMIEFPDYSADELLALAQIETERRQYILSEDAKSAVSELCNIARMEPGFGNGRYVRVLVDNAIRRHADRIIEMAAPTAEDLNRFIGVDFTD